MRGVIFIGRVEFQQELRDLIKLGNRVMDYLEGKQQAEIDALAARVRAVSANLKTAMEKE